MWSVPPSFCIFTEHRGSLEGKQRGVGWLKVMAVSFGGDLRWAVSLWPGRVSSTAKRCPERGRVPAAGVRLAQELL